MSEPREGSWIAKPLKPVLGWSDVSRHSMWIFCGVQAAAWLIAPNHPATRLVLVLTTLLTVVLFFAAREAWSRVLRMRDRSLADMVPEENDFYALVQVGVRGKLLGADRGVVWFGVDTVGFSGLRLSFLLAAADFLEFKPEQHARSLRMPQDALRLRAKDGQAYIVIRPLASNAESFRNRWCRFALEARFPSAERQWPPLVPYEAQALKSKVDETSTERLSQ